MWGGPSRESQVSDPQGRKRNLTEEVRGVITRGQCWLGIEQRALHESDSTGLCYKII
jgi:hypothetical protein